MILTLTGPNEFLIKQALDALTQKFDATAITRVSGDELEPVRLPELLLGSSLFASEQLIILTDAAKNKAVWDALGEWCEKVPASTTLVIVEPSPDKRSRTYKQLAKLGLQTFDELSEQSAAKWAQETARQLGAELDVRTANYLIQRVGLDQWQLWQELGKLAAYRPTISRESIDLLTEPRSQASAFELLDAVLQGEQKRTRQLLEQIRTSEDPYKFFGLLVSQIHSLAIVKAAGSKTADAIAKEAGLHPFVVRKLQGTSRKVTETSLKQLIEIVARCDDQLKSSGIMPWQLVEQALGRITSSI